MGLGDYPLPGVEFTHAPVQVARDMPRSRLPGWLADVDDSAGVVDLAVGELFTAPAQVSARSPLLGDRIGDPFPFDLHFHLREAAMTLKTMEPMGVSVSSSPPSR